MILQALYEYYQRNKGKLPPRGFQSQEIKFVIQIDQDGNFQNLLDKREGKIGKTYLLPKADGRSGKNSWQVSNLLWDHYGYILAHPKEDFKKKPQELIDLAQNQFQTFVNKIKDLPDYIKTDEGVKAVLLFYENKEWERVKQHPVWADCIKIPGCNLSFQLSGDECLIPERESIKLYQASNISDDEISEEVDEPDDNVKPIKAYCLITGNHTNIKRLHTATPIYGSKSNAKIVGFQKNSGFDSYYKEQAFNAPVSSEAEAAYSTALKHLIKSSTNHLILADTTMLFWSLKQADSYNFEADFPWYFKTDKDNPDKGVRAVKNLFEALHTGKLPISEDNRFYVLGLAPNRARLSVRFWKTGKIRDFAEKIKQHFEDFLIFHGPKEHDHLTLFHILTAIALEHKIENVLPNLAGEVIVSIIEGKPYPQTLLQQCIRRIRAEQNVNRPRAAILKACINRFNRFYNKSEKEIFMSLDKTNTDLAYRLGRLFAVLEKIQEEANPSINATIRDRFYGAASATPVTVYSQLIKLKNHHLVKLNPGRKVYFEKEIGEIFDAIKYDFPAHLTLDEQARFAVGYYHQRQDFFKKRDDSN